MVVGFGESGSHGILKGEGAGVGVQRKPLARATGWPNFTLWWGEELCQGTKWEPNVSSC